MTQRQIALDLSKSVPSENYGFRNGLFECLPLVSFPSIYVTCYKLGHISVNRRHRDRPDRLLIETPIWILLFHICLADVGESAGSSLGRRPSLLTESVVGFPQSL